MVGIRAEIMHVNVGEHAERRANNSIDYRTATYFWAAGETASSQDGGDHIACQYCSPVAAKMVSSVLISSSTTDSNPFGLSFWIALSSSAELNTLISSAGTSES